MRRATVLLCVAVAGLASCANGVHRLDGGPDRKISVGIQSGQITLEDPVKVDRGNGALVWELDTTAAGYEFGADGIKFEAAYPLAEKFGCTVAGDPDADFKKPQCRPQGKANDQFRCPRWNNHRVGACYQYTVTLKPKSGSGPDLRRTVDPKDPWILNQ